LAVSIDRAVDLFRRATTRAERILLAMIAVIAAVDLAALPLSGMTFVWSSTIRVLLAATLLFGLGAFYRLWRPSDRISAMSMGTAVLLLFSMFTAIGNYLALAWHRPLLDAQLVVLDAAFGFHWPSVVAAVQAIPALDLILTIAYDTTLPQIAVVVLLLALTGRLARLETFLLAFATAACFTVFFWTLFPSYGAFAHYFAEGVAVNDSGLAVNNAYAREMLALRNGDVKTIEVGKLIGLIAFPSFHTVIAALAIYATYPVRFAGKAFLALNVLVICSVPIDGGHHLIDVVAGLAVALAALKFAGWALGTAPREPSLPAVPDAPDVTIPAPPSPFPHRP
jgi:hypothetical protein